jgi:phage I-like protein
MKHKWIFVEKNDGSLSAFGHIPIPGELVTFAGEEPRAEGGVVTEIQVCRTGTFEHPFMGEIEFTKKMLREMVKNFRADTKRGDYEIMLDYNHASYSMDKDEALASGWVINKQNAVFTRNDGTELWARVDFTPKAVEYISSGEYRFISPEIAFNYTNVHGEQVGTALLCIGLVNRPFIPGMAEVSIPEVKVAASAVFHPGATTTPQQRGKAMDEIIRQVLGLDADVELTDAQREEGVAKLAATNAELAGQNEELSTQNATLQAAQPDPNSVTLSQADYTALKTNAEAGATALTRMHEQAVDTMLASHVNRGALAPADVEDNRKAILEAADVDAEIERVNKIFSAIPKYAVVPLDEVGNGANNEGEGSTADVEAFIEEKTEGGMKRYDAVKLASQHFTSAQFSAWNNRPTGVSLSTETNGG